MNSKYRIIGGSLNAWQWLPDDQESCRVIAEMFASARIVPSFLTDGSDDRQIHFETAYGHSVLSAGDWLVRTSQSVLWSMRGSFFLSLLEPAQYAGEKSRLELMREIESWRSLWSAICNRPLPMTPLEMDVKARELGLLP